MAKYTENVIWLRTSDNQLSREEVVVRQQVATTEEVVEKEEKVVVVVIAEVAVANVVATQAVAVVAVANAGHKLVPQLKRFTKAVYGSSPNKI